MSETITVGWPEIRTSFQDVLRTENVESCIAVAMSNGRVHALAHIPPATVDPDFTNIPRLSDFFLSLRSLFPSGFSTTIAGGWSGHSEFLEDGIRKAILYMNGTIVGQDLYGSISRRHVTLYPDGSVKIERFTRQDGVYIPTTSCALSLL
ncbi:hypothetical protein J4457_02455 [Candidatus Woesearchaeota archaeon]|nr:hypothetical protein [Candidatus Woesearchaeota archaeon]